MYRTLKLDDRFFQGNHCGAEEREGKDTLREAVSQIEKESFSEIQT